MRLFISLIFAFIVFYQNALASEQSHLIAYVVSSESSFTPDDVKNVHLKYYKKDDSLIVVIEFSEVGNKKLNNLLKSGRNKKIAFVINNDVVVGAVPINLNNTEGVLNLVVEDEKTALQVLKSLSQ